MDDKTKAAGVLLLAASTGRLLLQKRPKWIDGSEKETWGSWGGGAKEGESASETAVRELWEETKYDGPLTLFRCFLYHRPDQNFQYQNFVGVIPEEFEPELDLESEDARWVTMSELYGQDGDALDIHPGLQQCLVEARPMLLEMIKGLGILNEGLLREVVGEIAAG